MWTRRTFHECASELDAISEDFRAAYTNRHGWPQNRRDSVMLDASQRGVEVLRVLALSIRADQDFGLTTKTPMTVGALRSSMTDAEVPVLIREYRPPYAQLTGFKPLSLREALNKIAHADPNQSGFYADRDTHDLILSGLNHGDPWVAIISIIDLCRVTKTLPDLRTSG